MGREYPEGACGEPQMRLLADFPVLKRPMDEAHTGKEGDLDGYA